MYGYERGAIVKVQIPAQTGEWYFATLTDVAEGLAGFVLETPMENGGYGTIGFSYIRVLSQEESAGHSPAPYAWQKEEVVRELEDEDVWREKQEDKEEEERLCRERMEPIWEEMKKNRKRHNLYLYLLATFCILASLFSGHWIIALFLLPFFFILWWIFGY